MTIWYIADRPLEPTIWENHTLPGVNFATRAYARATVALVCLSAVALSVVCSSPARADLYSINSVEVDETAKDAVEAKSKAVADGQKRALDTLLHRLTRGEDREKLPEFSTRDIAQLMDGMSVENERTSGTRYIATLSIRFRAENIRDMLLQFDVPYADEQAAGVLLLTVWRAGGGASTLWDPPNPWRDAWAELNVENSITPLFMPLGDLTDISTITVSDVLAGDEEKLAAIRDRYAVENVLIATAESASGGGVRVSMKGNTAVGPVDFGDVFAADPGAAVEATAAKAARMLLTRIEEEWKANHLQRGRPEGINMRVAVPFAGLGEWNVIRERISETEGVGAIDVRQLSAKGAVVDIVFSGDLGQLETQLAQNGFELTAIGDTWVLQQR